MLRNALSAIFALTLMATPTLAMDASAVNNIEGLALKGFDPVAYFVDSKPRKGNPSITSKYKKVTYEFVSAEHKALFDKDPAKYIPTYNGFCAFGVSEGLKIDIDPHAYAINEGKLNVFFDDDAHDAFEADLANKQREAVAKWPFVQKLTKIIR